MSKNNDGEKRRCPGENYDITPAICKARQRNRYPKCLLCDWHELEQDESADSDPRVPSDIFRSGEVLGEVPSEVDEYVMRKVGGATAQLLRAGSSKAGRIMVGHDLRSSSRKLTSALSEGINQGGLDAVSGGIMPQEVLNYVVATSDMVGGAYVTGGNHPADVNGARLMDSTARRMDFDGGLDKIGLICRRRGSGHSRSPGGRSFADPMEDYRSCVQKFVPELGECNVVVDGAAGLAGRTVPYVFEGLPAELAGYNMDAEKGDNFLGQVFPAEKVLKKFQRPTRIKDADLCAAFDFAADRVVFFDEGGGRVRQDAAASLLARELLRRHGGGVMVYDLRASAAFRETVSQAGGTPVSSPTDRLSVARQMRQTDALYATDLQGRPYFQGFYRSNSPVVALLLMCSIVSRADKTMSELVAEVTRYHHSGEIKIETPSPGAADEALEAVDEYYRDADRERKDGLTVRFPKWWFNLRNIDDQPELRLNVEGRTEEDERSGRREILRLVKKAAKRAG